MKKALKILGIALAVLFVLIIILPYLMPLSKPQKDFTQNPYDNSAFETLEDTWIHYRHFPHEGHERQGKILMIHGFGGSTFSYNQSAPFLQGLGYDVVLVDLPGFGYSERRKEQNHSQMHRAMQLWTFLNRLNERLDDSSPWHLAGHSMGGGTVSAMAMMEPEQTASLILINAALFGSQSESRSVLALPFLERWVRIGLDYGMINERNIKRLLTSAYGRVPTDLEILGYLEPLRQPGTHLTFSALQNSSDRLPTSALGYLTMPAIAIWGDEDSWVPVSDTQLIKAEMDQLYVEVISGAGHCPMETHPKAFNELLKGWLE